MALEIVWRNPILQAQADQVELFELDRSRSIYIALNGDEVVIYRMDRGRTCLHIAETKRIGGA